MENAQDQVTVTYRPKALPKPTVKFTNPSRSGSSARGMKFTVKAVVKNVTDKKQIVLKMNGKSVNFDFKNKGGNISASVQLKNGFNDFLIEATNDSGKATAKTKVNLLGSTNQSSKT